MLRITDSRSVSGAREYFREGLRRADYYFDGGETSASWFGRGAERLGLSGEVEDAQFLSLLQGLDPETGEKLLPRIRADRRPGAEFEISVPKAVSLAITLLDDERIKPLVTECNQRMMRQVEDDMQVRVRAGGVNRDDNRVSGNIIYVPFWHSTTRPINGIPDPQAHIHNYVFSLSFDEAEQKWKAIQTGDIKGDGAYYEALFLNDLAHGMRALGYDLKRRGKWWSIDGVPDGLVERFSRRKQQIEAKADELGLTSAKQKDGLGATTRRDKHTAASPQEIDAAWWSEVTPEYRAALERVKARAADSDGSGSVFDGAAQSVLFAQEKLFSKQSVVDERKLITEALNNVMGAATSDEILQQVAASSVLRAKDAGRTLLSTPELIKEERAVLDWARSGRGTCRSINSDWQIRDERLNNGQRSAVRHVLTSQDRVMLVRGGAGTGKTTLMTEAVAGISRELENGSARGGLPVQVLAPSTSARDVLRDEGFATAETLQMLLTRGGLPHAGKGAVVWVDEAGLISVPQMRRLFDLADQNDWRLVLSGDCRQHNSVERGDAMRLLERQAKLPIAEVSEIMRQRGEYKKAVRAIEQGHVDTGWKVLEKMGAVVNVETDKKAERLAADYMGETEAGRGVLVVAPTHREKNAVTTLVRERLAAKGDLKFDRQQTVSVLRDLRWEDIEKAQGDFYQSGLIIEAKQNMRGIKKGQRLIVVSHDRQGDVVGCTQDGRRHTVPLDQSSRFKVYRQENREFAPGDLIRITEVGKSREGRELANGAIFKIKQFAKNGDLILDNGARIPADFGHLDYGYCTTSHSSQGRTVDTVLVAMGEESERAISQEQFYVSVSRGRDRVRIYTDNKDAIKEAAQRSSARKGATEVFGMGVLSEANYANALQQMSYQHALNGMGPQDVDRETLAQISALMAQHEGRLHDGPQRGM